MIDTKIEQLLSSGQNKPSGLSDIVEPLGRQLQEFRSFYKEAIRTDVFVLNRIVRYLLRQKGKEIRPTLVFMSARLFGTVNERSYIAATMIELLHTATLIHDDVVDEANVRRAFASINKLWKNKAGVLLGDYLLSRGLLIALNNEEFQLLRVLTRAVERMSEGELRQYKAARLFNMTEDYYFKVISEKTASLIAACCECGAISATDNRDHHRLMREIGMYTGIAFQIKDDLFDYGMNDVGKPKRNDIRERKVTLPFIKALENASTRQTAHMRYLMWKPRKRSSDIEKIVHFVHEKNGMQYSATIMRQYSDRALQKLRSLPASSERKDLAQLISFIINRKK